MSSEEESTRALDEKFWKEYIRKHWVLTIIFVAAAVGAVIGGFFLVIFYIEASAVGGNGTWTFDQFSMGSAIGWGIQLFLWELLLVVLPTGVFFCILIAYLWFKILPEDEKEELKTRFKKSEEERKRWQRLRGRKYESGGGGFSFLMFIGVCIKVAVDGFWLTPFGSLTFSYFIYAYITVFVWISIICGIPIAILLILWLSGKFGK